jgi:hypothetical protein
MSSASPTNLLLPKCMKPEKQNKYQSLENIENFYMQVRVDEEENWIFKSGLLD